MLPELRLTNENLAVLDSVMGYVADGYELIKKQVNMLPGTRFGGSELSIYLPRYFVPGDRTFHEIGHIPGTAPATRRQSGVDWSHWGIRIGSKSILEQ